MIRQKYFAHTHTYNLLFTRTIQTHKSVIHRHNLLFTHTHSKQSHNRIHTLHTHTHTQTYSICHSHTHTLVSHSPVICSLILLSLSLSSRCYFRQCVFLVLSHWMPWTFCPDTGDNISRVHAPQTLIPVNENIFIMFGHPLRCHLPGVISWKLHFC